MRQAIMTSPGTIEFKEVEVPEINEDQVLIHVQRIGVCGSDIHVYHGTHPYTEYPIVQGHEVSAVVYRVGSEVMGITPGDVVTFTPQITCGECYPCRVGDYHICDNLKVMGFQTNGAAQDFFPVDADKVISLGSEFPLDYAAMIEPIAVGVHAMEKFGNVEGKNVLVLGGGTIGNLTAQVAQALGATKVMITDISEYKIKKANACGIMETCNVSDENLTEKIVEFFGPDKADVIFECVGVQATINDAIENARKGSAIIVVGVYGMNPEVDLGFVQDRELAIIGTLMYQRSDFEIAIDLLKDKRVNLKPMITHRFAFENYLDAYEIIEELQGDYMKVMIEL